MLNISLNELFIIGILAVLFLKPKDFPIIIEKGKKLFNQALDLKDELLKGPYSIEKEVKEIQEDLFSSNKIIPKENKGDDNV